MLTFLAFPIDNVVIEVNDNHSHNENHSHLEASWLVNDNVVIADMGITCG